MAGPAFDALGVIGTIGTGLRAFDYLVGKLSPADSPTPTPADLSPVPSKVVVSGEGLITDQLYQEAESVGRSVTALSADLYYKVDASLGRADVEILRGSTDQLVARIPTERMKVVQQRLRDGLSKGLLLDTRE